MNKIIKIFMYFIIISALGWFVFFKLSDHLSIKDIALLYKEEKLLSLLPKEDIDLLTENNIKIDEVLSYEEKEFLTKIPNIEYNETIDKISDTVSKINITSSVGKFSFIIEEHKDKKLLLLNIKEKVDLILLRKSIESIDLDSLLAKEDLSLIILNIENIELFKNKTNSNDFDSTLKELKKIQETIEEKKELIKSIKVQYIKTKNKLLYAIIQNKSKENIMRLNTKILVLSAQGDVILDKNFMIFNKEQDILKEPIMSGFEKQIIIKLEKDIPHDSLVNIEILGVND